MNLPHFAFQRLSFSSFVFLDVLSADYRFLSLRIPVSATILDAFEANLVNIILANKTEWDIFLVLQSLTD